MTPLPLPRATPESQGVPCAAIAAFVDGAERAIQHLHSFMLLRHGHVIAEGWWHPYRAAAPHELYSLSKSFTSSAVGLAIAEGLLGLDDPVLKFFPAQAPKKISPNLQAMTVRHLLSMSSGHDQDTTLRIIFKRDPVKAFLKLPVEHAPGTHFVYNSGASYMLAAIVQQLTGTTLLDYLTPRLLEPLGIQGATWESHPRTGVNFGGWGLNLTTEHIARFGQLYLQKGHWQGRQLLPADWVAQATAWQVDNGPGENSDWVQGYGFHFWRCQPPGVYRGDGAFGQYCVVMPEQDAVLVVTGGLGDMQPALSLAWQTLLPAMSAGAQPVDPLTCGELARRLECLALPHPPGQPNSPLAAQLSGRHFTFEPNPETLRSLCFDFAASTLTYRLLGGGPRRGKHTLRFGHAAWGEGAAWADGISFFASHLARKVSASGGWIAKDTFQLTLCQYETPYLLTITFAFQGEQVTVTPRLNVSFGPTELPSLVGRMVEG